MEDKMCLFISLPFNQRVSKVYRKVSVSNMELNLALKATKLVR